MYLVDVYLRIRRAVNVEGDERPGSFPGVRSAPGDGAQDAGLLARRRATGGKARHVGPTLRQAQEEPYTGVIDRILEEDDRIPRKQRHTAKRIFERLRDEYGFDGGYAVVKDYVREHRRRTREMLVPLSHPPGHAECDFGEGSASHRRLGAEGPLLHHQTCPTVTAASSRAYPAESTEVFGSERLTGALLDRLTHHVHILEMHGDSYRLRHSRENAAFQAPDTPREE